MNKILMIFGGLILFLLSVFVWITNWMGFGSAALSLLQGGILWIVLLVGLVALVTGLMSLGRND